MFETNKSQVLLKPKDLALMAGVLTSKIAFYTSMGLLREAEKSEGGQKLYDQQSTLLQMSKIKRLIEKGLTLDEIKKRIGYIRHLRRILIIDDEQEVVEFVIDALKDQYNFDICVANDGFSAGKMLNTHFPDMIVLDLNLPGINGFDLCKIIRQEPLQSGVKILAVTGYYSDEVAEKVMQNGADFLLNKPFDMEVLRTKVFELLNIKKKNKKDFLANPKKENE